MEKSLVLSVSAGKGCYRHIRISEDATLLELSDVILESFNFIDDHLHAFFMNNHAWDDSAKYMSPEYEPIDDCGFTDKVKLSDFFLTKGDKFLYVFDFGEDWQFRISVLRVLEEPVDEPCAFRSVGKLVQYEYEFDEFDDDDDEDDDENDDL